MGRGKDSRSMIKKQFRKLCEFCEGKGCLSCDKGFVYLSRPKWMKLWT